MVLLCRPNNLGSCRVSGHIVALLQVQNGVGHWCAGWFVFLLEAHFTLCNSLRPSCVAGTAFWGLTKCRRCISALRRVQNSLLLLLEASFSLPAPCVGGTFEFKFRQCWCIKFSVRRRHIFLHATVQELHWMHVFLGALLCSARHHCTD